VKKSDSSLGEPVWDLPVRLFHWSIVAFLGLSWWSAEYAFDRVHFWSGHALLFGLVFRILWGFAGSSTARFATFVRGPAAVFAYLRGGPHGRPGHSPVGALSVLAMLLALIVQIATGLVQIDDEDFIEGPLSGLVGFDTAVLAHEAHEASFNVLLALIALHLLAIAYYQLIRRRSLVRPMVTGRAALPDGVAPMIPAARGRLAACAAGALLLTAGVIGAGWALAG
jgi:cytochrome b